MSFVKFLNLREVKVLTNLSKSGIYKKIKEKTFPSQVHLGENARRCGWVEHEIQEWMQAQIDSRKLDAAE